MHFNESHRVRQTEQLFDAAGTLQARREANSLGAPKISIVTPSFNQGEYLEECIESVLSQGYPNLEYIIMDGGSTDNSIEIIRKYEKYLAYWQSQPDGGQYPAINAGFRRSSGDIMAWINSDDRYYPGALAAVGQAFSDCPDIHWLTGRPSVIDAQGQITDVQRLPSLTYADYLDPERDIFLQQESTFWRRALWDKAGAQLDDRLTLAADFELWLRFFRFDKLYSIDRLLGAFRWHEGQKSGTSLPVYLAEVRATIAKEKASPQIQRPNPVATKPFELITSLVPRHDRLQRMAVRSWLRLGFRVISINIEEEQRFLKSAFPEVKFVTPRRDGRKLAGKPMVYFDDILEYCKTSSAECFGIINADIHLAADESLLEFVANEAKGCLVFGSRYEVDSPVSARGWLYTLGFDYFFFDRALLGIYPKSDFMLGVPWWDYWAPLVPSLQGFPIKYLTAPIAFHVTHPVNYNWESLRDFGLKLASLIGPHRINAVHERHNQSSHGGKLPPTKERSVTVLADMVRRQIYESAIHLEWPGPTSRLNTCGLIDRPDSEYRVTAIVSTYNSEAFIAECLTDLVNQSIAGQIEIIVIDAASPQNEGAVVAEFQRSHPNIRYIRTPERIGVYAAWNMVARMARGQYLISCSTNDRLSRLACETMARTLDERPEYDIAYGNSYLTREPHQSMSDFVLSGAYIWPEDASLAELLRQPNVGPHPMWRRTLHDEFGYFNEAYVAIADQDFWLRVARRRKLLHIHDFTGLYWVTEDSLSGRMSRAQAEYRIINEQHRRDFAYESWLTTRYFTHAIARHYEKRLLDWKFQPVFHVCIRQQDESYDALARTITSLSTQYYPRVKITVVSRSPAPPGPAGEHFSWLIAEADDWTRAVAEQLSGAQEDWLLTLVDGDTVDPRIFLCLGECISRNPDLKIIYTDEDELLASGSYANPHFKPPPNREWMLAAPYMGEAIAVSAEWLKHLGAWPAEHASAEMYDVMLRTTESAGLEAIAHLSDVLIHRPSGRWSCLPTQANVNAVQAHLQRLESPATLDHGYGNTLKVEPILQISPPVVIVIPFSGAVPTLERAITSLLQTTAYPEFRLLIVALSTCSPKAREFLVGLTQLGVANIEVHYSSFSAATDAMASTLGGLTEEFQLIWNENSVAVHASWLQELMRHGINPQIVAVGPRLATSEGLIASAGIEVGVMGTADTPYIGVPIDFAGDNYCLLVNRRVSALDPRCLLLKKSAAVASAGYPKQPNERLWATELALQTADRGDCLWTPHATVMVGEDLAQLEQDDQAANRSSVVSHDDSAFYKRCIASISCDRFRNPNFNLQSRGHVPESLPALVYDPLPWKPVPKIFARLGDREGCGHYRLMAPMRALLGAGMIRGGVSLQSLTVPQMAAIAPDVCIYQRQISEDLLGALDTHARYSGGFRIYEIDDLITRIPEGSPHYKDFTPQVLDRFRRGVRLCQRLIVSTEPLADAYRGLTDQTLILPNYLPSDPWTKLNPPRRSRDKPRVGWAGSASHDADLALMENVMSALSNEVDWVLLGRCPASLRGHVREIHPWVDVADYPARLAGLDLDLAIAPLEINAFNEAKSHLKLLEYGVLGYPVICTDIYPYQGDIPVTRLANKPALWINAIREQIHDPDAAAKCGQNLRQHVLTHWMLEDHLGDWLAAWLP